MSLDEFLAWFEGFTARIKGRPEKRDWSEILKHIEAMAQSAPLRAWLMGFIAGERIKDRPDTKQWQAIVKAVVDARAALETEKKKPTPKDTIESKDAQMKKGLLFKTLKG